MVQDTQRIKSKCPYWYLNGGFVHGEIGGEDDASGDIVVYPDTRDGDPVVHMTFCIEDEDVELQASANLERNDALNLAEQITDAIKTLGCEHQQENV